MKRAAGAIDKGLSEPQAEQAVLSHIVASSGEALGNPELHRDLFFNPPNLLIFCAAQELYAQGVKADFYALTQLLNSKGSLANAGGAAVISELQVRVPGTPDHFIDILKRAHAKRGLRKLVHTAEAEMLEGADVDDMIASMSVGLAELEPHSAGRDLKDQSIDRAFERIAQIEGGVRRPGISTGLEFWDRAFGGIVPSMFLGLAARPMYGKSALLEQVATRLLQVDMPVCIFALDMAPEQMIQRMACRIAQVCKRDLDHGRLDKQEIADVKEALAGLRGSKLRLHCRHRMTAEQMVAIARRDARKYGVKSFWLDHVQTLSFGKEEPRIAFGKASKLVRDFVNTEQVNFVVLAHLNREAAKGATVNQVKEFDDMLGDVDGMILLDSKEDPTKLAPNADWNMQFVVGKNRNGPPCRDDVVFNRRWMQFEDPPIVLPFRR